LLQGRCLLPFLRDPKRERERDIYKPATSEYQKFKPITDHRSGWPSQRTKDHRSQSITDHRSQKERRGQGDKGTRIKGEGERERERERRPRQSRYVGGMEISGGSHLVSVFSQRVRCMWAHPAYAGRRERVDSVRPRDRPGCHCFTVTTVTVLSILPSLLSAPSRLGHTAAHLPGSLPACDHLFGC